MGNSKLHGAQPAQTKNKCEALIEREREREREKECEKEGGERDTKTVIQIHRDISTKTDIQRKNDTHGDTEN